MTAHLVLNRVLQRWSHGQKTRARWLNKHRGYGTKAYKSDGILFPLAALTPAETKEYYQHYQRCVLLYGMQGKLSGKFRIKTHLIFPWMDSLMRHSKILDLVEQILGPDILVWESTYFVKNGNDPAFVSWHQDSTYWGLSNPEVVTAWVALTPSNKENGCMQVIPGSHKLEQIPHRDTFHPENILTRGQEVMVEVDQSKAVDVTLNAGEFSLHHVRLVHASPPNSSPNPRIGIAIRYIPTWLKPISAPDWASLVRGNDNYGHFSLEEPPLSEMDAKAVSMHEAVVNRRGDILGGRFA